MGSLHHISVCVCTYKRPEYLKRLLGKIRDQKSDHLFGFPIVVVDNDAEKSAETIIRDFRNRSFLNI